MIKFHVMLQESLLQHGRAEATSHEATLSPLSDTIPCNVARMLSQASDTIPHIVAGVLSPTGKDRGYSIWEDSVLNSDTIPCKVAGIPSPTREGEALPLGRL